MSGKAQLKRAQELDKALREFPQHSRSYAIATARLALEMQREELYRLLGYQTFNAYADSLDIARGLLFEMKKVVEAFEDLPVVKWAHLPKSNLKMMAKLPESKRFSRKYLKAAGEKNAADFRRFLNQEANLHLEAREKLSFLVEQSCKANIEKAIAAAKKIYELDLDSEALEVIAVYFMQGPCTEVKGKSNQEAAQ
jgi:hypothetical protein